MNRHTVGGAVDLGLVGTGSHRLVCGLRGHK